MVVLKQDNGMLLCSVNDKNILYFIGNYLLSKDDFNLSIVMDDDCLCYLMVSMNQYEEALKILWKFYMECNSNNLCYLNNKLSFSKWYYSSNFWDNILWYDINGNPCYLNERIIAKFRNDRRLCCSGKLDDDIKNYINDLKVYYISCDIFTDCKLLRYTNIDSELLFCVNSICHDDCLRALVDFVQEFGLGPFSDIEFYDEMGKSISKSKILMKKL